MTEDQLNVIHAVIEDGREKLVGTILDVKYHYKSEGHVILLEPEGQPGTVRRILVPDPNKAALHQAREAEREARAELSRAQLALEAATEAKKKAQEEYDARAKESAKREMREQS